MAVAYVTEAKLGVNLTTTHLLHSHIKRCVMQDEIAKQITFGRNNKGNIGETSVDHMPNVPTLFLYKQDPMSFRSLWCFLHESKQDSAE